VAFSEGSRTAIRHAGALAAQHGAVVHVVCIVAPVIALEAMAALGWPESEEIAAGKCEARLREMARQELNDSMKVESEVALGEPGREIVRLARESDADLIVISTHGYTGFKRALLGSTTEHVVRQAPCPVLVVREDEKDFVTPALRPVAAPPVRKPVQRR
jgi:nucleotide-binding universal stress UspA family protein